MFQRKTQPAHVQTGLVTRQDLLTACWTNDASAIESAVNQFAADPRAPADCRVTLFEIAGDRQLHVNVTHQHKTAAVKGWLGPAKLPQGFVHNRRFASGSPEAIATHIRDMVFARKA